MFQRSAKMARYSIIALFICFVIGCDKPKSESPGAEHGIGIFRDYTITESTEYHERFQEYYSKIKLEDWPLDVIGIGLAYKFTTGTNGSMDWGGLVRLTITYTDWQMQTFEIPDDEHFETWLESLRVDAIR